MNDLGRLEDLPTEYVDALTQQNLVPLWPSLRGVMPANTPRPRTQPTYWSYQNLRPLLLEAGRLTPIEKAERRVLVLANGTRASLDLSRQSYYEDQRFADIFATLTRAPETLLP